jgi:hypothetical protein
MAQPTTQELEGISRLSPADKRKALAEINGRPVVLPLNKREFPFGAPDPRK